MDKITYVTYNEFSMLKHVGKGKVEPSELFEETPQRQREQEEEKKEIMSELDASPSPPL